MLLAWLLGLLHEGVMVLALLLHMLLLQLHDCSHMLLDMVFNRRMLGQLLRAMGRSRCRLQAAVACPPSLCRPG